MPMASVPAANRNPRLPDRIRAAMTVEIPAAMTAEIPPVVTTVEMIPAAAALAAIPAEALTAETTAAETPAEKDNDIKNNE